MDLFFCQLQKLMAENEGFRFCELENDKKNVNSQFLQAFKKLKKHLLIYNCEKKSGKKKTKKNAKKKNEKPRA